MKCFQLGQADRSSSSYQKSTALVPNKSIQSFSGDLSRPRGVLGDDFGAVTRIGIIVGQFETPSPMQQAILGQERKSTARLATLPTRAVNGMDGSLILRQQLKIGKRSRARGQSSDHSNTPWISSKMGVSGSSRRQATCLAISVRLQD